MKIIKIIMVPVLLKVLKMLTDIYYVAFIRSKLLNQK